MRPVSFKRYLRLLFIITLAPQLVCGADLAGSGATLRMLQKIQGEWRDGCKPILVGGSTLFSETRLTISFTHLTVDMREYRDKQCAHIQRVVKEKYRFILGDSFAAVGGKVVYAFDLTGDKGTENWHPLNLIRFENGSLVFGLDERKGIDERLTRIDERVRYTR